MPHTRSAAKRHRQSEERRILNKDRTTELKTLKKKILRAVHDGLKVEAEGLYKDFSKRLDQAASVNTLHKNTASRQKSRVALAIAKGAPAPVAKRVVKADKAAAPKAAAPKVAAPKATKAPKK